MRKRRIIKAKADIPRVRNLVPIKINKAQIKGGRVMETTIQDNQNIGNCIGSIQAIASKYAKKTIAEEEQSEKEFREFLLKQGYTRY